ncbi:SIT4 phosphatase-associated protein-domain-containing protein [Irpex rosettiformis]|uniref:SIT4 phosphatase-associated protein-domain-containing protein n=1 Tax=Irpex rosettiformis TaxID=378272 RepID=A0ACB8UHW7_9APHY|nr:SIT4 phosphatase-associated protein-domain-containing protein [Irpex rosettiformis]
MFWRFGFHNASSIDSLLDKEDVSLEAILDEDELLQECKAQNTRLIDYFQRVDVLQRLLGYITGQIEGEGRGRFKYPYVATEVLCSEIWSIVETCISPSNNLLATFWETVLDRSPEDMKMQMVMASQFAKINSVFLSKKPTEMLAFIQAQPNVVERLLRHIETPAFADLLVRIIQLDELPSCSGVLDWLSKENLMSRLLDLLSPSQSPDMHTVVAELIKGIISMAAPSPGVGLGSDSLTNGPASNKFARELASKDSVTKLVGYILTDSSSNPGPPVSVKSEPPGDDGRHEQDTEATPFPNKESTTSSVVQSICIIIELIRQNNSDYFEPYLFHTLRNRLIQVQQHLQMHTQDGREALERAMTEMVNRMGVVHLGPVLQLMCDKLDDLQRYLREPRSDNGPVLTTVGAIKPLTFERYRICELYAELLHCSNMSLLNRPSEFDHLYDQQGRLQGGLSALEELAQVIAIGSGNEQDEDGLDDDENDEMEPAHEFPVSAAHDSSSLDSDDDMSGGSSDDDAMEDISMYDDPSSLASSASSLPENPLERFPPATLSSSPMSSPSIDPNHLTPVQSRQDDSMVRPRSSNSRRSSSRRSSRRSTVDQTALQAGPPSIVLGERLKLRFLENNVASTLLDLFFEFPWNNFLHSVVYDLIHQVLTGRIDTGYNRELTVSLFRDARLMHRIIEGSKRNDIESAKPKGVRLGYMGHLTLISEDVINSLEHFPPDLRLVVAQYAPQPEWDEYVTGRYKETKKKDTSLLGGGKPVIAAGMRNGTSQWKVDEAEPSTSANGASGSAKEGEAEEGRGELRRDIKNARESSADFGTAMDDDDDFQGPPQFARYLAQEMQHGEHMSFDGENSDDDEDDNGWLAQSNFDLRPPPIVARSHETNRQPLSSNSFEDSFDPGPSSSSSAPYTDPFEDDAFGPFSDAAAANGSEPFNFTTSTSDEADSNFDGFGDFGDFQSAGSDSLTLDDSGNLTPTADSWSFASVSSTGSEEDGSSTGRLSESPKDKEIRTAQ